MERLSRHAFLVGLGAIAVTALTTACSAGNPPPATKPAGTSAGSTTAAAPTAKATTAAKPAAPAQAAPAGTSGAVTVWTFLDINKTSPREKALKEIYTSYQKAHPNVKVTLQTQPFRELGPKFIAAA